jgi:hypothetical protein
MLTLLASSKLVMYLVAADGVAQYSKHVYQIPETQPMEDGAAFSKGLPILMGELCPVHIPHT